MKGTKRDRKGNININNLCYRLKVYRSVHGLRGRSSIRPREASTIKISSSNFQNEVATEKDVNNQTRRLLTIACWEYGAKVDCLSGLIFVKIFDDQNLFSA